MHVGTLLNRADAAHQEVGQRKARHAAVERELPVRVLGVEDVHHLVQVIHAEGDLMGAAHHVEVIRHFVYGVVVLRVVVAAAAKAERVGHAQVRELAGQRRRVHLRAEIGRRLEDRRRPEIDRADARCTERVDHRVADREGVAEHQRPAAIVDADARRGQRVLAVEIVRQLVADVHVAPVHRVLRALRVVRASDELVVRARRRVAILITAARVGRHRDELEILQGGRIEL